MENTTARKLLIDFMHWLKDGYALDQDAERVADEYLSEKDKPFASESADIDD